MEHRNNGQYLEPTEVLIPCRDSLFMEPQASWDYQRHAEVLIPCRDSLFMELCQAPRAEAGKLF